MKSWNEVKESIGKDIKIAQTWVQKKVYKSVDLQEQLVFASDIAAHQHRYLSAFFILLTKIAYRIESSILGLLGKKA